MNDLSAIWDRIDAADQATDVEERKLELEAAITALRSLIAAGGTSAWYPLGYAYYLHPSRMHAGSMERTETVRSLERAVSLGVEPALASLYLAHHYFDVADYENAQRYSDCVQDSELDGTLRPRLNELRLCIQIQRFGVAKSLDAIHEFAAMIEQADEWDIPPLVLINTLEAALPGEANTREIGLALSHLDRAYPIMANGTFLSFAEGVEYRSEP